MRHSPALLPYVEFAVFGFAALLGVALLAFHRFFAEKHRDFALGIKRGIERYSPLLARWYPIGPLWLYRLQIVLAGIIFVLGAVRVAVREGLLTSVGP
jgi:hypothetical protein